MDKKTYVAVLAAFGVIILGLILYIAFRPAPAEGPTTVNLPDGIGDSTDNSDTNGNDSEDKTPTSSGNEQATKGLKQTQPYQVRSKLRVKLPRGILKRHFRFDWRITWEIKLRKVMLLQKVIG